jgi:hypothetical protein
MIVTMDMAAKIESILSALCDTFKNEGTSFEENLKARISAHDATLRANKIFHILKRQSYDSTISILISLDNCQDVLLRKIHGVCVMKFILKKNLNLIKKANNGFLPFRNWRDIIILV